MADEASIRMTVDNSQAMSENQKYIRAATETFNILKQKSIELGISEKQRLDWMQREVELMKERSRLATAETVNRLYEDPKLSGKDRGGMVRATRNENREDLEEFKQLNKQIKEMREGQKDAEQKSDRLGQTFSRFLPQLVSAETAGGIASAGSGLLAGLGVAGLLAGIVVSKGLRGAAEMEPAIRDYAILMGSSMTGVKGAVSATRGSGIAEMGMTPADYFTKYAQLHRAGAGEVNENMLGIMAGEKARGVSLSGVLGVERYGEGKATNIERYFERYLRDTGQKIDVLTESLQLFTTEATHMVHATGRLDTEALVASITGVSKGFGLKGEPLQNVYRTLMSGLQQSSNPVIQALQYESMGKAMPGADLFQMQMAMENPAKHPEYMVQMLNRLKQMSGGNREMYARGILNAGLAPSMSLAWGMSGKDINTGMFTAEAQAFKRTPTGGYVGDAEKVTGATEKVGAALKGEAQRLGFNSAEAFAEELKKLIGTIADTYKMTADIMQKNNEYAEQQLDLARTSSTALGRIVHDMEFGVITNGSGLLVRQP